MSAAFRPSLWILCALAACALPAVARAQAFNLGTRTDAATGVNPVGVAIGDLNGDGYPDLVTANYGDGTVSVLAGNAQGGFSAHVDHASFGFFSPTSNPSAVAIADVNGDGKPDIIVTLGGTGAVSVLLNLGSLSFALGVPYPTGSLPIHVAVADVNGDGKLDLVTANDASNTVSVLLGHGDGTFGAKTDFATGANPFSVAIADVNNDGKLDLVVSDNGANKVSVLLGNGAGGFGPKTDFASGSQPGGVALGDVNGDGKLDILVTNFADNSVSVLIGNGAGGFGAKTDYATGTNPRWVSIGDMDGDGRPDLVTANYGAGSVSVLPGNGNGTFGTRTDFATGSGPYCVAIGDLNSDGHRDLVTASEFSNTASVLLANAGTGFTAISGFSTGTPIDPRFFIGANGVAIGDVNGDGKPDLVATTSADQPFPLNDLAVLLGDGAGGFGGPAQIATTNYPGPIELVDLNSDHHLDVVHSSFNGGPVAQHLGNGDGTFASSVTIDAGGNTRALAIGPLNGLFGDALDLVTGGAGVSFIKGLGNGTFFPPSSLPIPPPPNGGWTIAIGDLNGDSYPDLVLATGYTPIGGPDVNTLEVLLADGLSGFGNPTYYTAGDFPYAIAIADVNHDGKADVITADYKTDAVSVMLGNGNGTLGARTDYPTGGPPASLVLGDFDSDGNVDIATANQYPWTVSVLLGDGAGGFSRRTDFATQPIPTQIKTGDLNLDGKLDLVWANGFGGVSVMLGINKTRTALAVAPATPVQSDPFTLTATVTVQSPGHGSPTGTVSFFDGFTPIGSAPVSSGVATLTLPAPYAWNRSLSAVYGGNALFLGSISASQAVFVAPSSFASVPPGAPLAFALEPLAPNPASAGAARVAFTLPSDAHATLEIVDVTGRQVSRREVGSLGAGRHSLALGDDQPLAAGVYFVRLTQGTGSATARVTVLR